MIDFDQSIWFSECCDAEPHGELDMSTIDESDNYGGPSGFCSRCYDNCIFFKEDLGEPFDTREEKDGER